MVLDGVRELFGVTREEELDEILLFRAKAVEKVERRIALLEEIKRNGSTNAGTCISVVRTHKKAERQRATSSCAIF